MTTNASGKLNIGGVDAIKSITGIPSHERTLHQTRRLNACLAALRKQPKRWLSYQDWGPGGPEKYLADRGIVFGMSLTPLRKPSADMRTAATAGMTSQPRLPGNKLYTCIMQQNPFHRLMGAIPYKQTKPKKRFLCKAAIHQKE